MDSENIPVTKKNSRILYASLTRPMNVLTNTQLVTINSMNYDRTGYDHHPGTSVSVDSELPSSPMSNVELEISDVNVSSKRLDEDPNQPELQRLLDRVNGMRKLITKSPMSKDDQPQGYQQDVPITTAMFLDGQGRYVYTPLSPGPSSPFRSSPTLCDFSSPTLPFKTTRGRQPSGESNMSLSPPPSFLEDHMYSQSLSRRRSSTSSSIADANSNIKRGRPKLEEISELILSGSHSTSEIKCGTCYRVFPREKSLAAHMRTHTGERPYKCPSAGCSKAFAQSGQLRTHERLHTGEKPFECRSAGCGNRFTHPNRRCPAHPTDGLVRVIPAQKVKKVRALVNITSAMNTPRYTEISPCCSRNLEAEMILVADEKSKSAVSTSTATAVTGAAMNSQDYYTAIALMELSCGVLPKVNENNKENGAINKNN